MSKATGHRLGDLRAAELKRGLARLQAAGVAGPAVLCPICIGRGQARGAAHNSIRGTCITCEGVGITEHGKPASASRVLIVCAAASGSAPMSTARQNAA